MAQVVRSLPLMWETWMEFLARSFGRVPALALGVFEREEFSVSVTLKNAQNTLFCFLFHQLDIYSSFFLSETILNHNRRRGRSHIKGSTTH